MQEKYLRFGEYIKKKRLADPRELSMQSIADFLDLSLSFVSDVEKSRRKPFGRDKLAQLAEFLKLSEEETAMMYDLASKENREVPYDIEETLMYEGVGDLIRYATRQAKAGFLEEDDWKKLIRQAEKRKAAKKNSRGGGDD